MNINQQVKKEFAETDVEQPEVPEDFICIDPPQQPLVLDYLSNFNQEIKEAALIHLKLCLHCRELAATVLKVNRYLEPKSGQYLHAEITETETEQVS